MNLLTIADATNFKNKAKVGDKISLEVDLRDKDSDPEFLVPTTVTITGVYPHFVTTDCPMCPTLRYTDIIRGKV